MSEKATESGVVEGGHLKKGLKGQRMATVSFGGVIEARLFVGGWQACPYWRHAMGDSVPKRLVSLSSVSPNSLGVWQS